MPNKRHKRFKSVNAESKAQHIANSTYKVRSNSDGYINVTGVSPFIVEGVKIPGIPNIELIGSSKPGLEIDYVGESDKNEIGRESALTEHILEPTKVKNGLPGIDSNLGALDTYSVLFPGGSIFANIFDSNIYYEATPFAKAYADGVRIARSQLLVNPNNNDTVLTNLSVSVESFNPDSQQFEGDQILDSSAVNKVKDALSLETIPELAYLLLGEQYNTECNQVSINLENLIDLKRHLGLVGAKDKRGVDKMIQQNSDLSRSAITSELAKLIKYMEDYPFDPAEYLNAMVKLPLLTSENKSVSTEIHVHSTKLKTLKYQIETAINSVETSPGEGLEWRIRYTALDGSPLQSLAEASKNHITAPENSFYLDKIAHITEPLTIGEWLGHIRNKNIFFTNTSKYQLWQAHIYNYPEAFKFRSAALSHYIESDARMVRMGREYYTEATEWKYDYLTRGILKLSRLYSTGSSGYYRDKINVELRPDEGGFEMSLHVPKYTDSPESMLIKYEAGLNSIVGITLRDDKNTLDEWRTAISFIPQDAELCSLFKFYGKDFEEIPAVIDLELDDEFDYKVVSQIQSLTAIFELIIHDDSTELSVINTYSNDYLIEQKVSSSKYLTNRYAAGRGAAFTKA